MKQISLDNIHFPEKAMSKTFSIPKSMVFTNRYLYTSKQQRKRLGAAKIQQKIIDLQVISKQEKNKDHSGVFPIRRSNTNTHKILYKYHHPSLHIVQKQPSFSFKVQQYISSCKSHLKKCQSARIPEQTKSNPIFKNSLIMTKKQSIRNSISHTKHDSRTNVLSFQDIQFIKIDGWSTMPLKVKGMHN